jgi:ribose-phosphate pyrophosphokinase
MQPFRDLAVFSGNAHRTLAEAVCKHLEIPLGNCEVFPFSNEEIFVRFLDNIREKDVFLIQPGVSPVNNNLMELLVMIDAAKRASAGRITAVIPYYSYGRSDKKDQPRVPVTARLIANFLEVAGADRVLTLDLHAGQIQGFFNIPVDELTAFPMLADYFRGEHLPSPVDVAPDSRPRSQSLRYSGHPRAQPDRLYGLPPPDPREIHQRPRRQNIRRPPHRRCHPPHPQRRIRRRPLPLVLPTTD